MNRDISQSLSLSAPARNLQRLCVIRCIAWAGEALATGYAFRALDLALPYQALTGVLAVSLLIAAGSLLRLRYPWPVTDLEFFLHLLADVCTLSILMYLSGGATNPFVSYFLIPLTIAAATLPPRYIYALTGTTLAAYTLLLFHYVPVELLKPSHHVHGDSDLNWHILGMWINFVVSAVLITFFIVQMARNLRLQDQTLQTAREKNLRSEHIVGIAAMAANTTHALGTPLSTMAVLLKEMAHSHGSDSMLQQDIATMRQQIDLCKTNLRALMQAAERLQTQQHPVIAADRFLNQLLEQWQQGRPSARYSLTLAASAPPDIVNAPLLAQAIQNLLDNAADASPEQLEISADWNDSTVVFRIRDHGPGIPLESADRIGKPFFTTKSGGLGLGLFLSHATLDLFAGNVRLFNQAGGGTLTEVTVPAGSARA